MPDPATVLPPAQDAATARKDWRCAALCALMTVLAVGSRRSPAGNGPVRRLGVRTDGSNARRDGQFALLWRVQPAAGRPGVLGRALGLAVRLLVHAASPHHPAGCGRVRPAAVRAGTPRRAGPGFVSFRHARYRLVPPFRAARRFVHDGRLRVFLFARVRLRLCAGRGRRRGLRFFWRAGRLGDVRGRNGVSGRKHAADGLARAARFTAVVRSGRAVLAAWRRRPGGSRRASGGNGRRAVGDRWRDGFRVPALVRRAAVFAARQLACQPGRRGTPRAIFARRPVRLCFDRFAAFASRVRRDRSRLA